MLKANGRRRKLILGTMGVAGLVLASRAGMRIIGTSELQFEPLDDPPGFRRLKGALPDVSSAPFIGLDKGPAAAPRPAVSDLCTALFGSIPPPGTVPVASFSDYYCPYCRVLTRELAELERLSRGGIRVTWHEWPQLGPASEIAARAALAADMQDAYVRFHERMMRSRFVPNEAYFQAIAEDLEIDAGRMTSDMNGTAVTARLSESDAVARRFGFVGTPALVIGKTVVVGVVPIDTVARIAELEAEEGQYSDLSCHW